MTDVSVTFTTSSSPTLAAIAIRWVKNGGAPVLVIHPSSVNPFPSPNAIYTFHYLEDIGTGAATAPGDVISATVAEQDGSGNTSVFVAASPASVTIPTTPPNPPTSVTLALS